MIPQTILDKINELAKDFSHWNMALLCSYTLLSDKDNPDVTKIDMIEATISILEDNELLGIHGDINDKLPVIRELNDFYRTYKQELLATIGIERIRDSLYETGLLISLKQRVSELNKTLPESIDLSWLFNELHVADSDQVERIFSKLHFCIEDSKERYYDRCDEDEDNDGTYVLSSLEGTYKSLTGFNYNSSSSSESFQYKFVNPVVDNPKSFYELWLHTKYSEIINNIAIDMDIPLIVDDLDQLDTSHQGISVYDATIHKLNYYYGKLTILEASIDAYHYSDDQQRLKEILIRRVDVLKDIISYVISRTMQEKTHTESVIATSERNRILSNLSHSIKNMLKSVIDPLQNLKQELPEKAYIIDNALKGANLIREIVNSINLSFKTSFEELEWDVIHPGKENMSLQDMILDSLIYSIGNMFDFRYFPNFAENYFPRSMAKPQYEQVQKEWNRIASAKSVEDLVSFCSQYMFDLKLELDESQNYHIGNEKSSAIKLMILFQEMIFNAVKYCSFIPYADRRLEIALSIHEEKIRLQVSNTFSDSVRAKTTGVGKLIIENFAKVLDCEPRIQTENGIYSIEMEFNNIWRKHAQDPLR